mmetsp:Transcript_854/g.1822  ORF Transcript_854/g.1822 Transcript_854/m.1822 type:complete len:526 (+) Transcript_854:45-1622(+)
MPAATEDGDGGKGKQTHPDDSESSEAKRARLDDPPAFNPPTDSSEGEDFDDDEDLGSIFTGQDRTPFSLLDLEAEVESLRAAPPPYVSSIGKLLSPKLVCRKGMLVPPTGMGPWDLFLSVAGKEGDKAYGHKFRIRLRFKESWPNKPALVKFCCVFHHALTDESEAMMEQFYSRIEQAESGAYTVVNMVDAVHDFLVDGLAQWGLGEKEAPMRVLNTVKNYREMSEKRFTTIEKFADMVVHKSLFQQPACWKEEWLAEEFWKAHRDGSEAAWRALLKEESPGAVYSFPVFSESFCDMLLAEIFNFYSSGLEARRPNSMNNYGIILNEIGLEPLIDSLQQMLQPLGEMLFSGPGSVWDGQHCFIVRYRSGEDLGLDMHTDDSDVTVNICLGLQFEGAGLQFCGLMGAPAHRKHSYTYHHVKGRAVFHLGRQRHGADDITSGERLNLILWNHSSTYRQSKEYKKPLYRREASAPDVVCVSYTHDRDFGIFKDYPKGKDKFKGRGWCPPKKLEYDGFQQDAEPIVSSE